VSAQLKPRLSQSGLAPTLTAEAVNEYGETVVRGIAAERPLTLFLDKREVVTLMTLGQYPEQLVLGYLHNQRLLTDLAQVEAVQVDWETSAAVVTTRTARGTGDPRLEHRTVTSGCGQGTLFGNIVADGYVHLLLTNVSDYTQGINPNNTTNTEKIGTYRTVTLFTKTGRVSIHPIDDSGTDYFRYAETGEIESE